MSTVARRPLLWLWTTVAVQLAGRILDGIWHANHDEFEGASEQLQAHWLAWIGALATLVVAWLLARAAPTRGNPGYVVTAAGATGYVALAVWHFIEHAGGNDPALAHVLIALTQAVMFVGVLIATVMERRRAAAGR